MRSNKTSINMVKLYVAPHERRKGMGTRLYQEAMSNLELSKPNLISTDFAVDRGDPAPFYKQLGFKKWYACVNLEYTGGFLPEPDQEFVPYDEKKHFHQYVQVVQDSFYQLHRDNDIYPYRLPADDFMLEFVRSRADRTYLAMDGDKIMAATIFKDGCLEFLMVSPNYQGLGLGRKAAQYAMNSLLAQGAKPLNVCCVIGNDRADALYRSLGFETVTTYHVYRQFGDRD